jgi:hypothetical protein
MPGLLRGIARTAAVAGTASAVSGRVQRRQARKWAREEPAQEEPPQQQQAAAPPPPAPAAAPVDPIHQLKELADLKAQGVLTDEEFAAQKARILA